MSDASHGTLQKRIPIGNLKANPHNPRLLFDREPMQALEASIKRVGVLVPITVYWSEADTLYVILDGQRRWMCCKDLKMKDVPANIVPEPTLVQNIVTMFQIHRLREDWELMPTALKLGVLMEAMEERRDAVLATLTGLDKAVVVRCKKLLSFDKRFQDRMLDPDADQRVKADFFIELYAVLSDSAVKRMKWFGRKHFTEQMLDRYEHGGLKSVTEFRRVKQLVRNAEVAGRHKFIEAALREFAEDRTLPVEHLADDASDISTQSRQIAKSVTTLTKSLKDLDVAAYYGEEDLWKQLEDLLAMIRDKLSEADRRPVRAKGK